MENKTIKQLSEDERPREKIKLHGVEILTDAELLAVMLGSGTKDKNVVELRLKGGDETSPIESFERGTPHPKAYIISQPRVRVRDI